MTRTRKSNLKKEHDLFSKHFFQCNKKEATVSPSKKSLSTPSSLSLSLSLLLPFFFFSFWISFSCNCLPFFSLCFFSLFLSLSHKICCSTFFVSCSIVVSVSLSLHSTTRLIRHKTHFLLCLFSVRHHTHTHTPLTHARPHPLLRRLTHFLWKHTRAALSEGMESSVQNYYYSPAEVWLWEHDAAFKRHQSIDKQYIIGKKNRLLSIFLSLSLHSKLFFWPPPPFQLLFATSFFSLNTTERQYYRWQKELFWDRYEENRTVPLSPLSHVFLLFFVTRLELNENSTTHTPACATFPETILSSLDVWADCLSIWAEKSGEDEKRERRAIFCFVWEVFCLLHHKNSIKRKK